ncbi:XRE family transcriptional regulator [Afifella sp. IM 167]|uniref:helix-turn-helix domain-containing protein n=1 Tax=Afifella sp. IM 167 TaxID=2033586 RepID=UPI001CCB84DF
MAAKNDDSASRLGRRLRAWRTGRGLTLAAVSQKTGVASSSLSKIENEQVSVSYHTLKRICDGLDMPIEDIINPEHKKFAPGRRSITRAPDGSEFGSRQYIYRAHATDMSKKEMIPLEMVVLARASEDFEDWNKHEGEEFVYVLSGAIDVLTEFYAPTRLTAGESLYFDSSMGHMYISVSDEDARILSICYDPRAHMQRDISDFFRAGRLDVRPLANESV